MRIKTIQLSWFRGAADPVALELDCKSMVVYGGTGSGKSSFVDAVEYALKDGKIGHLAHEYSGRHQEKAIPNTHKPGDRKTELKIKLGDDSVFKVGIAQDGSATRSGAAVGPMNTWDYRRMVLRQDEVAAFIHETKGGKYSALLPLLGLHEMEVAAENVRQLVKAVEQQSELTETKAILDEVNAKRAKAFGTDGDEQILQKIQDLHSRYCADEATVAASDSLSRCTELETAIDTRLTQFPADQKRHIALLGAAELELSDHVAAVRVGSARLADATEPLISEKLEVLQSTGEFVGKLGDLQEVQCPACGQPIAVDTFQSHVEKERERLEEIMKTFDKRKVDIGILADTVKSLKSNLSKPEVKSWREKLVTGTLADNFAHLDLLDAEALRSSCGEEDLKAIEEELLPLIDAAVLDSKDAPRDVRQLSTDKQTVEVGKSVIVAKDQTADTARAEALVSFISSLEQGIRQEIRLQSRRVISEISVDIQVMWAILHPDKAIEDVRLYLPKDADKAIEIGLKFHSVDQDSPRLTLSEGYRNSLGLCIFLAMAKREGDKDRPLFLDDVVVSLDRNHRGMIVELLEKEFGARQVVILTHQREWYTELRQQLDGKSWAFKTFLPYETPDIGIRWSHKTTTFDDARTHLQGRPDSAGNDARKIMDVELSLIAERLRIWLPYLRGDKNDMRMAHEFLVRFMADGVKCFEKKGDKGYVAHTDAIQAFGKAHRLLLSWANRASHSFDIVRPEAMKLIDTCEKAVEFFECSSCGKKVWFADARGPELVQCRCGEIRWRYGKR